MSSNVGAERRDSHAREHHTLEHPAHLRVLTLNFWGIEPVLEQRLALAKAQMGELQPDVICLQEVRPMSGREGPTTAHHLADALGYRCVYERALEWRDDDFFPGHPAGQEGLAILARHAIHEHRVLRLPEARPNEKRILLSALVDTAADPVWVHTTHLHYRLEDGLAREKQVVAISEAMEAIKSESDAGAMHAVQILCGDFNATPDHDEIRYLRGLTTLAGRRVHLQDAFARVHPREDGITWSSENELTRPLRSLDINRRLDYIFVTPRRKDGRGTVLDARVVMDRRDADGRCASDHYGVLADVQISENPRVQGSSHG